MSREIHLGFEIGTGTPVKIPVGHMCFTGQTQRSGKTTALEAAVSRSGMRAVAFITKRGEGSFRIAQTIQPYFRERADWRFVQSILELVLETSINESTEARIMKVCDAFHSKGESWPKPKSMEDVYENILAVMKIAKWRDDTAFIRLKNYMEVVLPELRRLQHTDKLELEPGLNVMDLTRYSFPLQQFIISSVLRQLNDKENKTIVIIPEAWKFMPQGRSSPVRLEAERMIREGAARDVLNFVWFDCQDMRGADKNLFGQVRVWGFGVQKELNELDRTVGTIPNFPTKMVAQDIQSLQLGQFVICVDDRVVKTYVWPAWMSSAVHAQAIARGDETVESARDVLAVYDREHERRTAAKPAPPTRMPMNMPLHEAPVMFDANRMARAPEPEPIDWKERFHALADEKDTQIQLLQTTIVDLKNTIDQLKAGIQLRPVESPAAPAPPVNGKAPRAAASDVNVDDAEALYQSFRARLMKDPAVLAVAVQQPEITVKVERPVIEAAGDTLRGALALLIHKSFFDVPRKADHARNELTRTIREWPRANVYKECDALVESGFLTKEPEGYRAAAGVKPRIKER